MATLAADFLARDDHPALLRAHRAAMAPHRILDIDDVLRRARADLGEIQEQIANAEQKRALYLADRSAKAVSPPSRAIETSPMTGAYGTAGGRLSRRPINSHSCPQSRYIATCPVRPPRIGLAEI